MFPLTSPSTCPLNFPLYCRVSLTVMWTQQGRAIPWEERLPKAFFRGRDSNQARLDLVQRHHRDTENYDVGLTNYFFFPHKEELYGPIASYVGMSHFFKVSVLHWWVKSGFLRSLCWTGVRKLEISRYHPVTSATQNSFQEIKDFLLFVESG